MYYIVRNGEIIFTGSEQKCVEIIQNDMTGEIEMYPEEGHIE